ncbi:hypothetical protein CSX00_04535 [Pseudobutyrivibrio ruminis]|uniref:Replication restart DNA helicase PriA n=1 Tax=Pseudobutyrivibrio ruminis TaxID=46206 RepID=A0A2G3EBF8_9FIRM|nr:hypothetical protein [Pseudobutyrivibrio ruminis]PHU40639.1 hypothetical protein CSX00_04535 [Pseudobutyrivibrio ruminis]
MATMFPCPNCGGQLRYSIKDKQLKCMSCGELTDVEQYKPDDRINADSVNTKIYTCPTCNGEIQLIDNDGMEFCPFCGNQVTMQEHFSTEGAPKYVLPFMIDKQEAKQSYIRNTIDISFAPTGLNDDANVEKLVPLYTPYYLYDYNIHDKISYKAERYETTSQYYVTYKANIKVDMDLDHLKVPFDASQALDDEIAEKLEPFPMEKLKPFNPNYLAGFFVENSTVEKDLYKDDSEHKAVDYLTYKSLDNSNNYSPEFGSKNEIKNNISSSIKYNDTEGAYLPLYFMTTRYGDRVAYSIINGATGQTYLDMPIEKRKMFIAGAFASLGIFALLVCLSFLFNFSFKVKTLCLFSAFMSSVIAYIGAGLANKTYRSDNHLDDKGYYMNNANLDEEHRVNGKKEYYADKMRKSKPFGHPGQILGLVASAIAIFVVFQLATGNFGFIEWLFYGLSQVSSGGTNYLGIIGYIATGVIIIIAMFKVGKGKKTVLFLGVLSWILAVAIRIINNPDDLFYYGALIIVFTILVISINAIVDEYNRSATHPSPHFERKGGGIENARN